MYRKKAPFRATFLTNPTTHGRRGDPARASCNYPYTRLYRYDAPYRVQVPHTVP